MRVFGCGFWLFLVGVVAAFACGPLLSVIQNSFDSKLTLLIGGYRDNYRPHETLLAFEHNTKTWKELDVRVPCFDTEAVVLDEELYAICQAWDSKLFKLIPENGSWIKLSYIPRENFLLFTDLFTYHRSVAYKSKIYVIVDNILGIRKPVFAYDPVANSWSELAPIKGTMLIGGITVINDKLCILEKGWEGLESGYIGYYDTVEDEWTYLTLNFPGYFYSFVATYKNELVFFANPDVYTSNLDERTPLKKLPQLKYWRKYAAVFTCENSLFVAGGRKNLDDNYQYSDEVESFDGMTWTEMPRMPYGVSAFGISTTVTATGDLAKQLLKWSR